MPVPDAPVGVVGGVDTHADTLHVAVINDRGHELEDREFPTTPAGYRRALAFLESHGEVLRIGVEGTSSYGAGFTRVATSAGFTVVEVNRPDRAERRRQGKSDPIDAYQAARSALGERSTACPKGESIEGIRALHNTRRSAVKARTAAINQIRQLLVTAPDPVREKYRALQADKLIVALARCRIGGDNAPVISAILTALKTLAQRCQHLTREHAELGVQLDVLVAAANPGLRGSYGVGPDTAAQLLITAGGNPDRLTTEAAFAALCGAAPIPASSGKITRHRLSRGGDRAANNALYRIALVRMSSDSRTRDFVSRQIETGRTKKEILRILKRAIAREIFRHLTTPTAVPGVADLRITRQVKNITLSSVAQHLQVWPAKISDIERGTRRDDNFAVTYREWLNTA